MSTPNDQPPPNYTPPPGYGAGPNYQPPPGYGPPPGFRQQPGGPPPSGNVQAQLQTFVRNAQMVITKPSVANFDAIQPYANWNTVLIALGIAGVVRGLLTAITDGIYRSSYTINGTVYYSGYNPVGSFIGGIFGTFLGFFVAVGIWWLIARYLFRGTGAFMNYAHATALILAPLFVLTAVLGFIPILGGLASFVAEIYALYLVVLATASTHRISTSNAVWTVLIPVIVGLVLGLLLAVLAAAVLVGLGIHVLGH